MTSSRKRPMGRTLAWLFVIAAIGSTPAAGQSAPTAAADKAPVESEAAQPTASPEKSTAPAASPVKTDVPAKAAAPAVEAATAPPAAAPAVPAPAKAAGPAAAPAVVPAAKPATASSTEPVGPGEKDVYTEFTDKVLKSETESWKDKIDPLAARYPDDDVIVCSAGCGPGGKIVSRERKAKRRIADQAELIPSAASTAAAPMKLECVAGCFSTPKSYRSVEKRVDLVSRSAAAGAAATAPGAGATADALSGGKWTATVARAEENVPAKPAAESGNWMSKINGERGAPSAPVAPESAKSASTAPAVAAPAAAPAVAPSESKPVVAATQPAPASAPAPASPAAPAVAPTVPAVPSAATAAPSAVAEKPQVVAKAEAVPEVKAKPVSESDAPISVSSDDPEMNSAIGKARASLSQFWAAMDKPAAGETGFSLKVAISDKGQTEHFWLTKIERKGDKLSGTINNKPALVKSVRTGQVYEFTEGRISDWLFMRKGKMVGNQTMRPLLTRMPAEEADAYRAMLETP